jgi:hypothetical protein
MSKHKKKITLKNEFCGARVYGKCQPCQNNYRYTNKPKFFPYQAHHLIPVTCVGSELMPRKEIDALLRSTKWCINAKDNMLGMPIWADTVRYYCVTKAIMKYAQVGAPEFADIPQHLNDHDYYNEEVRGHLHGLAIAWEEADHDAKPVDIAGDLETMSGVMNDDLDTRGSTRAGGTHKAWTEAVKASPNEYPDWYMPFSMAADGNVRKRAFPMRAGASISSWIQKIQKALTKA